MQTPVTSQERVIETGIVKIVEEAINKTGLNKQVSLHTFTHSFTAHLPKNENDLRTIREFLRHKSLNTIIIYTHLNLVPGIRSQ